MKQTKINLGNVLLILAAVGFGFASYLSINFITLGDTKQSLIGAIIISIILSGLAFGAQRFKKANRKFKTNIIFEIVFLLLFIIAAYFAIQPFSHVFTVFQHKKNIENKVVINISQAQNMFNDYEGYANKRISAYKRKLNSVVASKNIDNRTYRNYGFDSSLSDTRQINTKTSILNAKLFPSNYKNDTIKGKLGIKGAAVKWLDEVNKNVKSNFSFMFGIVNILNKVPIKTKEWRTDLIRLSKYRAANETANNFDYALDFRTVKNQLTEIESPTILSVVLALILYLMMLSPYLAVSRSTKFPFLYKKKSEQEDEDDGINVRIGR